MDDFLSLLSVAAQLILSVAVPLGAGALIVSVYEQRKRVRERAVDRFIELVLTRDFFNYLTLLYNICDILDQYDKVKAGNLTPVLIGGSFVPVGSASFLDQELGKLMTQLTSALKVLQETGPYPMSPPRLRVEIARSFEILQRIDRSLPSGANVSEQARNYRHQLDRIHRVLGQIVYGTEL